MTELQIYTSSTLLLFTMTSVRLLKFSLTYGVVGFLLSVPVGSTHLSNEGAYPPLPEYLLTWAGQSLKAVCSNYARCGFDRFATDSYCCLQCSCEPSCVISHTCCPESGYHIGNPDSLYQSTVEGSVCKSVVRRGEVEGVYIHPEYDFLHRCLPDTPREIKDKCETLDTGYNVSLILSTPLYDPLRDINYGNLYCALCNNVSLAGLAPWVPSLECLKSINAATMTLLKIEEKINAENCTVKFDPPDFNVSNTICYKNIITTCNVTGKWTTYDSTTDMFCRNLDTVYVSHVDVSQTYKNIFCAMCNGDDVLIETTYACPFKNVFDITISFATVLQFTMDDIGQLTGVVPDSTVASRTCTGNFAFDPLEGRCMRVFCSLPLILDGPSFQCKNLFDKTSNIIGGIPFAVIFRQSGNFTQAQSLAEDVFQRMTDQRYTTFLKCSISMFYQTTLRTIEDVDTMIQGDGNNATTGLYVTLQYYLYQSDPTADRAKTRQELELALNTTDYFYMGQEVFDAGMLQYFVTENTDTITTRYESFRLDAFRNFSHYMFLNPYDGTYIIGVSSNMHDAVKCEENFFKDNFLPCPWLQYDVSRFSKTNAGLRLTGTDVTFDFEEFKTASPNSTEVSICTRTVIDKVGDLFSHQSTERLSTMCILLMLYHGVSSVLTSWLYTVYIQY